MEENYLDHTLPNSTVWKVSKYGVISGPYFPVFGLNTEIYFVNLRIQFEYRKIRTRNNSVFGHFSRSGLALFTTFLYPLIFLTFCFLTFSGGTEIGICVGYRNRIFGWKGLTYIKTFTRLLWHHRRSTEGQHCSVVAGLGSFFQISS